MSDSYKKQYKDGFVKRIVLFVVAGVFLLNYFDIDIRGLFDSLGIPDKLAYIWSLVRLFWHSYIKTPIIFILNWLLEIIQ